jgi:hypothetical protein
VKLAEYLARFVMRNSSMKESADRDAQPMNKRPEIAADPLHKSNVVL